MIAAHALIAPLHKSACDASLFVQTGVVKPVTLSKWFELFSVLCIDSRQPVRFFNQLVSTRWVWAARAIAVADSTGSLTYTGEFGAPSRSQQRRQLNHNLLQLCSFSIRSLLKDPVHAVFPAHLCLLLQLVLPNPA